ncbi:hypothetical protein KIPB_011056, partial [Kipferlia bialata]
TIRYRVIPNVDTTTTHTVDNTDTLYTDLDTIDIAVPSTICVATWDEDDALLEYMSPVTCSTYTAYLSDAATPSMSLCTTTCTEVDTSDSSLQALCLGPSLCVRVASTYEGTSDKADVALRYTFTPANNPNARTPTLVDTAPSTSTVTNDLVVGIVTEEAESYMDYTLTVVLYDPTTSQTSLPATMSVTFAREQGALTVGVDEDRLSKTVSVTGSESDVPCPSVLLTSNGDTLLYPAPYTDNTVWMHPATETSLSATCAPTVTSQPSVQDPEYTDVVSTQTVVEPQFVSCATEDTPTHACEVLLSTVLDSDGVAVSGDTDWMDTLEETYVESGVLLRWFRDGTVEAGDRELAEGTITVLCNIDYPADADPLTLVLEEYPEEGRVFDAGAHTLKCWGREGDLTSQAVYASFTVLPDLLPAVDVSNKNEQ